MLKKPIVLIETHFSKVNDPRIGHGRIDIRECWSTSNLDYLCLIRGVDSWVGLKSIAMVICTRIIGEKETKEVRARHNWPDGLTFLPGPLCVRLLPHRNPGW